MNIRAKKLFILIISAVMVVSSLSVPAMAVSSGIADLFRGFSEWNQGQQQQFWDWVDNQTNQQSDASSSPSPASDPTPSVSATPSDSVVPDDLETSPTRDEPGEQIPTNENDGLQGLETGYYTIDGNVYYYNAETGEMQQVTPVYYEPDKSHTEPETGDNYHIVINGDGNHVVVGGGQDSEKSTPQESEPTEVIPSEDGESLDGVDSEQQYPFLFMVLGGVVVFLTCLYVLMRILENLAPYAGPFEEIFETIASFLNDFFDWIYNRLSIIFD